nr:hypothetical protein [Tanacetum cinerariifolium]
MLNSKRQTSFAKPEFLKKAQRANHRLYDIGCYNDNLALMLAPESDEVIRLEKESRSTLSDLIRLFDYDKLNNLYDLFVSQREKSSKQRYFSEISKPSHTPVNHGNSKESFNKQTILLEKRMNPFREIKSEMVADLRYFNYLELEVDSLRSKLETQKTQFLNEIDRLSREYYYADHMNAILGVYTELDELVEIVLFIVDSRCSKHMTGNLKLLINFVEKFLGTMKFGNDQIAPILGYGDLSDIVVGLPKLKFVKDHLCSSCELRKAKRKSFQTKITPSSKRWLQLLHMDLCGPMRVANINGKRYVLVIVDGYSRYTWTHFLRSKDETPEVLIDFLRLVQKGLHAQTLHAYFDYEEILHQTSVARTPKQNGVVERRNRTLVEAARTILSAAKVPLFFWAEAIGTACFTQNRKNLDKMKEKGDACIFVGYSTQSRPYRVFNKRTRVIVETIHVNFDELPHTASDHVSYDVPPCQSTALEHDSISPSFQCQQNVPHVAETVTTSNELDLLFSPMFDELLNGSSQVVSKPFAVTTADAPNQCQQQHTTPLTNQTTTDPTCQVPTQAPTVTSTENINQADMIAKNAQVENDEFINIFCTPVQDRWETSSRHVDSSNMHTFYQHHPSQHRWTKDHPLEQVIGNPSQSVRTRRQLESDGEM